jgi:hypothetical protein
MKKRLLCAGEPSAGCDPRGSTPRDNIIDLSMVALETNSSLWQVGEKQGEQVLYVSGNTQGHNTGCKTALVGNNRQSYSMQVEMRLLRCHSSQEGIGRFGFVMHAQDVHNFELVSFAPDVESGMTVAYLSVAHGVVPRPIEACAIQDEGICDIPCDEWFRAWVYVVDDEFTLRVEDRILFTENRRLTYYRGRPGFYVGDATDAAFRRLVIEDLR